MYSFIFFFYRIVLAIELIEEAALAVADIPTTLFFPAAPFCGELFVWVWFGLVAVFLASSGQQEFRLQADGCALLGDEEVKCETDSDGKPSVPANWSEVCSAHSPTCEFYRYGNPSEANWLQVFNFFALLWCLFFSSAAEEMIMAGAFAAWYFTRDKKELHSAPLIASVGRQMISIIHTSVVNQVWQLYTG